MASESEKTYRGFALMHADQVSTLALGHRGFVSGPGPAYPFNYG